MNSLELISQAHRLLEEAKTLPEIKEVRDKTTALLDYFKRKRDVSHETILAGEELKVRAERKIGGLLKTMERAKGGTGTNQYQQRSRQPTVAPTLADLGLTKDESSRLQKAAELPEEDFEAYITGEHSKGEAGEITSAAVHRLAKQQEPMPQPTPIPKGKYKCLVVDPPWPITKQFRKARPYQEALDYPTMTLEEIEELNLGKLAAPGCQLYLWTTHGYLPRALEIVDYWGFKYHCVLTWVKNVGMTPFGFMFSTEHVIFAYKPPFALKRKGVRLDFSAEAQEHSRKPEAFYELVREVSPAPRLELFSRETREGFTSHGNEKGKFDAQKMRTG